MIESICGLDFRQLPTEGVCKRAAFQVLVVTVGDLQYAAGLAIALGHQSKLLMN